MATSHRSETNETVWRDLPPSSTELSSKLPTDKLPIAETYFPPGETAFGSEDLDSPVKVITEPDLEPPKGYPKDVHGVATLTLLIDTDGHVRWVNLDSTDFKAEINERITEAFSKTLFYPPYKNGKPVRAVFKIQINIGEI